MKARHYSLAAALALAAASASAERIETYWRLEPIDRTAPTRVEIGTLFYEQRLLPVAMVALDQPVTVGQKMLAVGTPLYLVFNEAGKIAYCTLKDGSPKNQAQTLFIPLLDQRPCLADSANDGRFDRYFTVYDKDGGTPAVRGSIDGAQPLAATAAYHTVDVHDFPRDMTVSLAIAGRSVAKASIYLGFSATITGIWPGRRALPNGDHATFEFLNTQIDLTAIDGNMASIVLHRLDDLYISSDNRNTLYWRRLPAFVNLAAARGRTGPAAGLASPAAPPPPPAVSPPAVSPRRAAAATTSPPIAPAEAVPVRTAPTPIAPAPRPFVTATPARAAPAATPAAAPVVAPPAAAPRQRVAPAAPAARTTGPDAAACNRDSPEYIIRGGVLIAPCGDLRP